MTGELRIKIKCMARTEAQKRYCRKRLKCFGTQKLTWAEWEVLWERKRKLGYSWLECIYRGLGLRREDVLNSLKNKDSVTPGYTELRTE